MKVILKDHRVRENLLLELYLLLQQLFQSIRLSIGNIEVFERKLEHAQKILEMSPVNYVKISHRQNYL